MIHVLDALVVRPGDLAEVRRRVERDYEPVVSALGMRRARTWIAPAVELHDRPTELLVLWELDDIDAFWAAKRGAADDGRVAAFWSGVEPLLTGRTRRIMVDPASPPE